MTTERKFCPQCGAKRVGFFRYCGQCHFDFEPTRTPSAITARAPTPQVVEPPSRPVPGAAPVAVAPTNVAATKGTRSVRRYALYGVLGLLGLGAVSNILNPQSDPVATPLPSRALIAAPPTSTATIASRPSPTLSPTPSPSPSPTPDPTPKPTPTRIVAVDDGFYFVEPDGREEFRGTNGTYTYSAIAFSAERATVRWTATAPTGASCRVVWRLDPSSGSTIKRTVKVSAGAKVSGNARYGTTFDDAAFLVDSTCPQWNMSITGQKRPASGGGSNCDPSYPGVCIPPHPPDLDCGDVEYRRFDVIGSDPHGFDGDNDGIGCESG